MDHRNEELKVLKKASKRVKRKKTAVWKIIAIISLVLALLLAPLSLAVSVFDQSLSVLFGDSFRAYFGILCTYFDVIGFTAAFFAVLFVAALIPWSCGKRRWKRSQEYLDYKTLKTALELEKNEK